MGYTYDIDPQAMFKDRFDEFVTLGVPKPEVAEMQSAITDMWSDTPGGWTYEWSRVASQHAQTQDMLLASLAYGCAKFPCLATDSRRVALSKQAETYIAASSGFGVKFERRLIEVPFGPGHVKVPVHIYSANSDYKTTPTLLFNGGVDTWKMDSHRICVALAQRLPFNVLAFDQPGTGETAVPLSREADEVVLGLVKEARALGDGKIAHFGMSFGANYSAMTGLLNVVDASIVLGGPVDHAFAPEALRKLPYGMRDIIGNDMGFARQPSESEFIRAADQLARRDLLDRPRSAPMLVINGAEDYFVPQADTLLFGNKNRCEVHLIPGTGHCAFSKLPEVMSIVMRWLPAQLSPRSV